MKINTPAGNGVAIVVGVLGMGMMFGAVNFRSKQPKPVVKYVPPSAVALKVDEMNANDYGYIKYSDVGVTPDGDFAVRKAARTRKKPSSDYPLRVDSTDKGYDLTQYEEYEYQKVDSIGRDALKVDNVDVSDQKVDFLAVRPKPPEVTPEKPKPVNVLPAPNTNTAENQVPRRLMQLTISQMSVGETKFLKDEDFSTDANRHIWIKKDALTENWGGDKQRNQVTRLQNGFLFTLDCTETTWGLPAVDIDEKNFVQAVSVKILEKKE